MTGVTGVRRAPAVVLAVVAAALAAFGCGVPADEAVRTIPRDAVPFALTSPSVPVGEDATATDGAVTVPVYFFDTDEDRLVEVRRAVRTTSDVQGRIDALLGGPTQEEVDRGLATLIAEGTALVSPPQLVENGVVVVDLSAQFTEGQATEEHLRAVAQMVWTVTDVQGVRAVLFQRDGEIQREVNANGEQLSEPLDRGEFVRFSPAEPSTSSTVPPTGDGTG